ncbi:hypothetical protein SUGI_1144530 [Cryptomeria japonica]|uniref:organic cation/carnitine transporter 1-like n=1 Tax=Cryptomeria japonica TaxID=3369 RepID=UPI0024147593|nr:organic cation/carnitine transporter 1-like [Cryptomeria japonica]GLJ53658.1 hypothetical protein SUGI_1144530 [Cryptomeria japonica]
MESSILKEQREQKWREKQGKKFSLDEIIESCIGGFGGAQLFQVVVVSLGWVFDVQHTFLTIFTDAQPTWRCTETSSLQIWEITGMGKCTEESSVCKMDTSQWEWERGKAASIISEWDLMCGNSFKAAIPGLLFFVGALAGYIILGPLADTWLGRKRMLILSSFMLSVSGILTAMSPNIWIYSLLRAITGFVKAPIATCCLVLSTELVGRKWRGLIGFLLFLSGTIGFLSIPALAYLTRLQFSWRMTYIYLSLIPLLYSLFLLPCVWESPRWLLLQGRSEEALQNLKRLAELNGGSLPENVRIEDRRAETQSDSALSRLWGTQWARKRLILVMAVGAGIGLIYFGLPLGVGNLGFNLYISVTLNALSELPAGIISTLLVARARRRRAILLLTLTSASFCFVCVFLSGDRTNPADPSSNQTKSTAGKYPRLVGELGAFVSAVTAFNVMLIFCLELFPTTVRNSAMSMFRQASGVGAIASPVIVFIGRNSPALSFALSGIAIILSGFFVLGLPETKDQPLYDTLEGQEWEEKDLINRSNKPLLS